MSMAKDKNEVKIGCTMERTNLERKSCVPIVEMSMPSIKIRPLVGST
jgi:hypothetical protein